MQEMIAKFKNGKTQEAAADHRRLLPVFKGLFAAPNPSPVKAALNLNGVAVGGIRLPIIPLNDEETSQLRDVLRVVNEKAATVL